MALRFILGKVAGRTAELAIKPKCCAGLLSVRSANYFVYRRSLCTISSSSSSSSKRSSGGSSESSYDSDMISKLVSSLPLPEWETESDSTFFKKHGYVPLRHLPANITCGGSMDFSVETLEVIEAANLAVKLYNEQQNAKLELLGIHKAEGSICAGFWFELLLEAVDHASGVQSKYETSVWLNVCKRSLSKLKYLRLASD